MSTGTLNILDRIKAYKLDFVAAARSVTPLAEHRAAQAELRTRGLALVDEDLIFETILKQRALIAGAVTDTRRARRWTERRDRALGDRALSASSGHDGSGDSGEVKDRAPVDVLDLPFYDVEEWS